MTSPGDQVFPVPDNRESLGLNMREHFALTFAAAYLAAHAGGRLPDEHETAAAAVGYADALIRKLNQ